MKNNLKVELLFDYIRAPYDIAHIIQVALALDNCKLYTSGSSLSFDHPKVRSKVFSWKAKDYPKVTHFEDIGLAIKLLKSQGKRVVGTSPHAKKSFYELDCSTIPTVFVFGNESTGIPKHAYEMLDETVCLPMSEKLEFLTLPVAVPAVAFEINRQISKS